MKTYRKKCIYCKQYIYIVHQDGIEFINGYPTPCRMNGRSMPGVIYKDELPWVEIY